MHLEVTSRVGFDNSRRVHGKMRRLAIAAKVSFGLVALWAVWVDPLELRAPAIPSDAEHLFTSREDGTHNTDALVVASVIVGGKDKDPGNSADDYASLTFRNHLAYCRRHGYDYVLRTRAYDRMYGGARTAQWDKIRLVVSLLERGYRLVFWTDSDSLFTRCGQSIEAAVGLATQPHADFFFTGDHNYALNSGQFLVRNTPWASAFLERWWAAGDDPTFLHSSCHDHLDNGGGIFALFALVAGREHCGDGHRLSRNDRKVCEADCNQLMRGRYVTTADCSRLHAALNRTARVRCLPQTAINSYYVGKDGNDWWPGHFRVHVPGNQRVKLVKLRLISWLFAPLLMC